MPGLSAAVGIVDFGPGGGELRRHPAVLADAEPVRPLRRERLRLRDRRSEPEHRLEKPLPKTIWQKWLMGSYALASGGGSRKKR